MQDSVMRQMWQTGHLSGGNAAYVEELYELWLQDPQAVPDAWHAFFSDLPAAGHSNERDRSHAAVRQYFVELDQRRPAANRVDPDYERKQIQVFRLIDAYRACGFRRANTDPLGLEVPAAVPELALEHHGLSAADFSVSFNAGSLFDDKTFVPLSTICSRLEKIYCGSLGAEFFHIPQENQRRWLQNRLESAGGQYTSDRQSPTELLARLTAAEGLEKYLAAKYPGTKRFGLEGAESLIPLLDEVIERSGTHGAEEVVIGMAHRGRLNVLVNILGKNPADLFDEFEGKINLHARGASGDVKYHQGFSSNVMTQGGEVHLALAFNPSHLEIVSPVVQGSVRARQDRRQNTARDKVVPVAIHGDAAFAGQGVVMETFQLSRTRAYNTGGTIHIIVNNQVGFTTSRKEDARSTDYCTDVARMLATPVLRVNGDDPAAVVFAAEVAVDFRNQFGCDCVIDLVCYRRRGHNEADEPAFTQPLMYQQIRAQQTTRALYAKALVDAGVVTGEQEQAMESSYRAALSAGQHVVEDLVAEPDTRLYVDWSPYVGHAWTASHDTRVPMETLRRLGQKLCTLPEGFVLQRQVGKMLDERRKMAAGEIALNWGMAELLAYASLLTEGHPVRMTGQDVGRGTFSHRHAVLHSQQDGSTWVPLAHLDDDQSPVCLYDSVLSEEAVLAFEYGYATTRPRSLVIWEAQFGDFANGAQVVIDQFITSGEAKWGRLCGLTMLLPHGYEGQGPEHSSARLERFLQLCAQQNIQVCVPTTPAQVFHMLRRQVVRPLRKPLVVFSPKSLLRHKLAVSSLESLSSGKFQTVIPEVDDLDKEKVTRLVLCSGKVYYDLLSMRREKQLDTVAIVRIEQLYPFPESDLEAVLAQWPRLDSVVWCQEEPKNQGAWYCSQHHMQRVIAAHGNTGLTLEYAGRPASAAPACGYMSMHLEEQEGLVARALNYVTGD